MRITSDWAEDYFPLDSRRLGIAPACLALLIIFCALAAVTYGALQKRSRRIKSRGATWDWGAAKRRPLATLTAAGLAVCASAFLPVAAVLSRAGGDRHRSHGPPSGRAIVPAATPSADQSPTELDRAFPARRGNVPSLARKDRGVGSVPPGNEATQPLVDDLARQAEQQFSDHDFAGAISTLNRLDRIAPGNPYYLAMRAYSYYSLSKLDAALADANRAISLDSAHVLSRYVRASVYEEVGEYQLAEKDIERALESAVSANNTEAVNVLAQKRSGITEKSRRSNELFESGKRHFRYGEYRVAIAEFTQVIALKPNSFASYHWRAIAYDDIGEFSHAVADLDAAIALNPGDPSLFEGRAYIHEHMNDLAAARKDIDEAIRLDPNRREYVAYRARLLSRYGHPSLLSQHFNGAVPDALRVFGLVLLRWPFPVPIDFAEPIHGVDWPSLLHHLSSGNSDSLSGIFAWARERPDLALPACLKSIQKCVKAGDWSYLYSVLVPTGGKSE